MKYAFISHACATHAVRRLCALLQVSPAGYYEWRHRPVSLRAQTDDALSARIIDIHRKSRGLYGSPKIHADLADQRVRICRKRVARLMRAQAISGSVKRAFRNTTNSNHAHPIAANILNRKFKVAQPNTYWVGDITYIPTREGWLYLAIVLDLASRKVVGWAMDTHMRSSLVIDALSAAITHRRPDDGLIFHSDRGRQYCGYDFQAILAKHGIVASMSRKAECWDNAVAESFFSTLKRELGGPVWISREIAKAAIFEYIEIWYNRQRRHSKLGYLSPVSFETKLAEAA